MLSNTAIPIYYGEFRQKVITGEIPVCETISLQMNRIDDKIRDPNLWYDPESVEGFIEFCENELVLTDGGDLKLLDSFKLWAEDTFGWYYFVVRSVYVPATKDTPGHYVTKRVRKRLCTKIYILVARGAAKSLFAACVQAYGLTVDIETTMGVVTAPTMIQCEEIINPIRTAITKSRGPFFKFLTRGNLQNTTGSRRDRPKLFSSKKGIENTLTNSIIEVRAMSIAKLQGLRNKYSAVDEWLSGDIREDVIGALEQGASKLDDYLIISTSSEGTIRNGAGDTIKIELRDILKGNYIAPNVSIWWYKLDELKEIDDPALWIKANPNIGFTVSYEVYQRDVERLEKVPAARNDIIAKRFGIPMEGYTYYFTYEETLPTKRRCCFWSLPCSLGCDLSRGDDFCAFTFLFPLAYGHFGLKARSYITENTLMNIHPALRLKYDEFIREGSLIVMPDVVLNLDQVYEDLIQHIIDSKYDVRAVGYDPYNAKEFIGRWVLENGQYCVEKVIQGSKTESVPLGEMKKMTENRLIEFDEEIITWTMGNCVVLEDTNGNRKLYKIRKDQKIDNVSAWMDAYVAYTRCKNEFE